MEDNFPEEADHPDSNKLYRDSATSQQEAELAKEDPLIIKEKENENHETIPQNADSSNEALISSGKSIGERSWLNRTFGKMEEGSIRGGIFSLSSLALGTGAFSLPIRCTQVGCVWYVICIIIGSFAAYWSLSGMIKAAKTVEGDDYSTAVKKIMGKIPGLFIDCVLILYLFGVLVQYQVIVYSLIGRTYYEFFVDHDVYKDFENDYEDKEWDKPIRKFPIMFGTVILITPVCLLKNISKMRFASLFGICALVYAILVVVIQSPWFFLHFLDNHKASDANWFDISQSFDKNLEFFPAMATVFFAFSCHSGAFPVYKTLKNPTEKRANKIFLRSVILDLIINLFISFCGFITAPLNPKSLIVFRDNDGVFSNDIFMIIAKISLALDLFLCIPVNYAPFRCSFFLVFLGTDKIDNCRNFIVTITVLLLSTLVGALYKDILSYIAFLGGFCSSIFCFLMPGWMMIKTSKEKVCSFNNIFRLIIIVVLCSIGFTGAFMTIFNNFR